MSLLTSTAVIWDREMVGELVDKYSCYMGQRNGR